VTEPPRVTTDYDDEYSESLVTEFRKLQDALLSDTVSSLASPEPILLGEGASTDTALAAMIEQDRIAVLVIDAEGRLTGLVTDRDLLKRTRDAASAAGAVRLGDVMTRGLETVSPDDRMCYVVNRMMAASCRTVPVVDGAQRPLAMVTVDDITKWLAALFPEAILNLRPGDRLKQPNERDGG
jgi:CBS domain-containing protein